MNRPISPPSIAPPAANYAHAVVSEAPSRMLHTSGVVPVAADGSVPSGLEAQAAQVWDNIDAIVSEAAMAHTDIVSIVTYVVAGEDLGPVMTARDAYLDGHLAASTLVTVPALAQSTWRLEVAVVAAAA